MFSRVAMTTVPILLCGLFASSVMGQPVTPNSNQPKCSRDRQANEAGSGA